MTESFSSIAKAAVLLTLAALQSLGVAQALPVERQHLTIDGQDREFLVVRPDVPVQNPALVLVLHGHIGSAGQALGQGRLPSPLSLWLGVAEREHIVVAALDGLRGSDHQQGWNDCRRDTSDPTSDDVAFAEAVVSTLEASEHIDPTRVYVMGMSNGAMMTLRLGIEMQPAPAAIAVVAGSLAQNSQCPAPARPMNVLIISGTKDRLVPFEGSAVGGQERRGQVIPMAETVNTWLSLDGIDGAPRQEPIPTLEAGAATHAVRRVYPPGATGKRVVWIIIEGGGHIEPSVTQRYGPVYDRLVGPQNHDFEAVDEAWRFFQSAR